MKKLAYLFLILFGQFAILSLSNATVSSTSNSIDKLNVKNLHQHGYNGQGMTIAIIDGGFDYLHEELKDVFVDHTHIFESKKMSDFIYSFKEKHLSQSLLSLFQKIRDLYNTYDSFVQYYNENKIENFSKISADDAYKLAQYQDLMAHGTHVSGLIASEKYGIAPAVKIIPIDLVNRNLDKALEIVWNLAQDKAIDAVNISYRITQENMALKALNGWMLEDLAKNSDIIVFKSAGNYERTYGDNLETQSLIKLAKKLNHKFIVAGNLEYDQQKKERMRPSSDRAGKIKEYYFSVPGTNLPSTLPFNSNGLMTGTSMSSPVLAGFYLLLKSALIQYHNMPKTDFSSVELIHLMKNSTRKLSFGHSIIFPEDIYGNGVPDGDVAMKLGQGKGWQNRLIGRYDQSESRTKVYSWQNNSNGSVAKVKCYTDSVSIYEAIEIAAVSGEWVENKFIVTPHIAHQLSNVCHSLYPDQDNIYIRVKPSMFSQGIQNYKIMTTNNENVEVNVESLPIEGQFIFKDFLYQKIGNKNTNFPKTNLPYYSFNTFEWYIRNSTKASQTIKIKYHGQLSEKIFLLPDDVLYIPPAYLNMIASIDWEGYTSSVSILNNSKILQSLKSKYSHLIFQLEASFYGGFVQQIHLPKSMENKGLNYKRPKARFPFVN